MKLEVGKQYRRRDGKLVKIVKYRENTIYAGCNYISASDVTYTDAGCYYITGEESAYDIIEEVETSNTFELGDVQKAMQLIHLVNQCNLEDLCIMDRGEVVVLEKPLFTILEAKYIGLTTAEYIAANYLGKG
jgi:hypothetical protein